MRALTVLEVLFALILVAGVVLTVGVGAGLIVGGALGVLSCEWTSARLRSGRVSQ